MKKLFIILFFAILFAACSRSANNAGGYCYTCRIVGGIPTFTERILDTCSQVPSSQYSFRDANGNDLSFVCESK